MAVCLRIKSVLIISIQISAILCGKSLCISGKCASGHIFCNLRSIFELVVYRVPYKNICTPFGKDVKITVNPHIVKVESLLFAVIHVEPTSKGVVPI